MKSQNSATSCRTVPMKKRGRSKKGEEEGSICRNEVCFSAKYVILGPLSCGRRREWHKHTGLRNKAGHQHRLCHQSPWATRPGSLRSPVTVLLRAGLSCPTAPPLYPAKAVQKQEMALVGKKDKDGRRTTTTMFMRVVTNEQGT